METLLTLNNARVHKFFIFCFSRKFALEVRALGGAISLKPLRVLRRGKW